MTGNEGERERERERGRGREGGRGRGLILLVLVVVASAGRCSGSSLGVWFRAQGRDRFVIIIGGRMGGAAAGVVGSRVRGGCRGGHAVGCAARGGAGSRAAGNVRAAAADVAAPAPDIRTEARRRGTQKLVHMHLHTVATRQGGARVRRVDEPFASHPSKASSDACNHPLVCHGSL